VYYAFSNFGDFIKNSFGMCGVWRAALPTRSIGVMHQPTLVVHIIL
jgi:hypothetical protein